MRIQFQSLLDPKTTTELEIDIWAEVEKGLSMDDGFDWYNHSGEWLMRFPVFRRIPDTKEDWWIPVDQSVMWMGYYEVDKTWYVILRLAIERFKEEWRIYQIDFLSEKPPERINCQELRGGMFFNEQTGMIGARLSSDNLSWLLLFVAPSEKHPSPLWPRPFLEGWTKERCLWDQLQEECQKREVVERKLVACRTDLEGVQKNLEEILDVGASPLRALMAEQGACVKFCATQIDGGLQIVSLALQSALAEIAS